MFLHKLIKMMEKNIKDYSFMADAMLGKIARKLRMFGFDTIYDPNIDDIDILNSKYEGRIVLTSDRMLFKRCKKKGIDTILTYKETEIENLLTIFSSLNIKSVNSQKLPYLCTRCNGLLDTIIDKNLIKYEIPVRLLYSNKIFYKCTTCRKIYWRGSHMEHVSHLIEELNMKLTSLN
jgi:uncharacterized protein with PIN domain